MLNFLKKLFGDSQGRTLKSFGPVVDEINAIYETLHDLTDDELRGKTTAFKATIAERVADIEAERDTLRARLKGTANAGGDGQSAGETLSADERQDLIKQIDDLEQEWLDVVEGVLDEILPEAFAVVKETCRRMVGKSWQAGGTTVNWDMVPYDVQLLGGIALHQGKIAEMKTGEGKTLVGVAPMYLNALPGRGVHVVTVNPYLATRDSEWMQPIFEFHGLTVDVVDRHEPNGPGRRAAYAADITYGTNNEFGFDYLRDNSFVFDAEQLSQRHHHFAIIDEVDSVLVDEARTPLIISGPVPQANDAAFGELKPAIERLVLEQQKIVAAFAAEAERHLKERDRLLAEGKKREASKAEDEAGLAILRVSRGFPKSKKLSKLLQEPGVGTLLQKTEFYYLQDNAKNMPLVDEPLLFALDEKQHSIEMTEKGIDLAARRTGEDRDLFILPDIGEEIARIEAEHHAAAGASDEEAADAAQRAEDAKRALYARYAERAERLHAIEQLLRAYTLYEKDVEYIVQEGKVMIVDEHTGRVLSGRRYSDGLHQAIEAKENVEVQAATQTYATITLQNYFRLYHKLAGMTGTAETEAEELYKIYKLDVVVVPTNRPVARVDQEDVIYRTKREKYKAVIDQIRTYHEKGQPVLVGTTSVEASEQLSRMLQHEGVPHNVLNARRDRAQQEADTVALAGQKGAVTIATNMAGRGTDIKLGPGVKELGGLAILGTERHESRRIDLQLRGRSGRQGDPGESVFFVSFEDDLMRLFGDRAAKVFDTFKLPEGESLVHPWASKSIERAQKKVEQNNFGMRKRQLEYDDVLNAQRTVVYDRRRNALVGDRTRADLDDAVRVVAEEMAARHADSADADALREDLLRTLALDLDITSEEMARMGTGTLADRIEDAIVDAYEAKRDALARSLTEGIAQVAALPPEQQPARLFVDFTDGRRFLRATADFQAAVDSNGQEINDALERAATLAVIDEKWTEHLRDLDEIKEGIHLRSYGQKDPLIEYKMEAFRTFEAMMKDVDREVVGLVLRAMPLADGPPPPPAGTGAKAPAQNGGIFTPPSGMPGPKRRPAPGPRLDAKKAVATHDAPDLGVSEADLEGEAPAAPAPPPAATARTGPGRNDLVTIANPSTGARQTLKYKHAEARLREGWVLVD